MKRIIASLMATVVGTTAATSVVACGQKASTRTIDIYFGDNLKYTGPGGDDYSESDNLRAYNGGPQSLYKNITGQGLAPLSGLLTPIVSLFSFDKVQLTKPDDIAKWRKLFVGMDDKTSVDGLYFGEKVEHLNPVGFYAQYKNTAINSLGGLYQLYSLIKDEDLPNIGQGAQDSYEMIKPIFDSPVGYSFIDSFLSLSNQSVNSSWMSVSLSSDTTSKSLDSRILPFNIKKTGEGDKQVTDYQFEPGGGIEYVGEVSEFLDVNTKTAEETGHDDDKVGNKLKDPFNLLMLPTVDNLTESDASFDVFAYPGEDDEEGREALDGSKNWDIHTPEKGNVDWKIKVAKTSDKDKVHGFVKLNDSVIVPVQPLKLKFVFSTDTKNSQATQYIVDVTVDGIQAVFNPIVGNSQLKDDDKDKIANQFVKWRFNHYQFNNQVDLATNVGSNNREKTGSGFFSGMKIKIDKVEEMND